MKLLRLLQRRARNSAACALLLLLIGASAKAAPIDLDGDGRPDVWAMLYNASGADMAADADGDGQTDAAEAAAGTDPFRAGSTLRATRMWRDIYGLQIEFHSQAGKRYQVQSAASLAAPVWENAGAPAPGTGGVMTITAPEQGRTDNFYRVRVQDIDSDGDGVTDWEELALGFNPHSRHSGGLNGPDDLAAITQALQAVNVVTVTASDEIATEPAAGAPAIDPAAFVIRRTGNLNPITVQYTMSGGAMPGVDYEAVSGSVKLAVGARSATVVITARTDALIESPEAALLTITPDAAYTVGAPVMAAVMIHDHVQVNGSGLVAEFFNEASSGSTRPSSTIAPLMTNRVLLRDGLSGRPAPDAIVDNNYTVAPWPGSPVNSTYFASRWTGEVLPEFSQVYVFYTDVNSGGRLWVNGELLTNNWPRSGYTVASGEAAGAIELQGGVRYSIVFEHYETTGNNSRARLSWSSANQPKQIIPQNRLFANRAPQILSPTEVLVIKDSGQYSYQIVASGKPSSYGAANLPPGWSVNAAGLITGQPSQAGAWRIPLTATNAFGSGSAILVLEIIETGGGIAHEVWTGVPGSSIGEIPLDAAPSSSSTLTSIEAPQNAGDDFGARIRGHLTAPATGVYKFFLTGDEAAELWISDDEEPVNAFKRAQLTAPTSFRGWTEPGAGKSPLLWLEAGRRYYIEVRHKEAAGADHISVGWLKPGQGGADPANAPLPAEVVPGYALTPFIPAEAAGSGESILFTTNLRPQGGAVTNGFGSSSVQLSADETRAILRFTYSNLSTRVIAKHIHADAWNGHPDGEIIFDIDDAQPQADGSFVWDLAPNGTYTTKAEIVRAIKAGVAYINIHTINYPAGEIRGHYRLQAGSTVFTPPPGPPASWTGPTDHSDANAASRFLIQTTFGVSGTDANGNLTPDAIEEVQSLGYDGWIDQQFTLDPTHTYPWVYTNRTQTDPNGNTYTGSLMFNSWWRNSITAPDQLRQRVGFALSEIFVVSEAGVLDNRSDTLSSYYDMLLNNAFGNLRTLIESVTLHPAMGRYLDMLNNDKPDRNTGRIPNENYAREVLQLFSIGLNRLWPDGTLMLNSNGEPIPTYNQEAIIGFSHVFTGWGYNYTGAYRTTFPGTTSTGVVDPRLAPMREVPLRHFTGQKRLLNNVVLPGLATLNGQPLDPYATHSSAQYNHVSYIALPPQELDAALDAIFQHPNIGPFICRQLIQRLVTSTPSPGYLYRVVRAFEDNGSGVRGDMQAVIKAILLDFEARSADSLAQQGFGKQREPLVRVTAAARAFPAPRPVNGTFTQSGTLITVTTSAPHLYGNGNTVYLDFGDGEAGSPDDAPYSVTVLNATQFTVRSLTSQNMTYSQTGSLITMSMTSGGSTYSAGTSVYIDFTSGSSGMPADGLYTSLSRTSNDLQFTTRPLSSKTGSYAQSGNIITFTSPAAHGFSAGSSVHLDFTSGSPSSAVTGVFTVASVSDNGLQFTIAYPADAIARSGGAVATPAADAVNRTGAATTTKPGYAADRTGVLQVHYSDWGVGDTDTDLSQTPMKAATVFNFFLPDYQFPGILAQAGLITPEFELTSDTTVIRQVNFLYNGIFTQALSQSGLSSFRSGARDIFLDLRPWMGAGPGGLPWVHNNNLDAFINRLNTLLTGGRLSPNARAIIRNYAQTLGYSATPTATQLRDRARAVVHLIVTSPDFTIQK